MMYCLIAAVWRNLMGVELELPFPRMSYDDAIRRYGSDKTDIRIDLEIQDVSEACRGSGFRVFDGVLEADGHIVAIVVPGMGDQGRGYMDRLDKDIVRKRIGAGGLV